MKFIIVALALVAVAFAQEERNAQVLSQSLDITPEGLYKYDYETSNGIRASVAGLSELVADGSYSYTAPDGQLISVVYLANENGFQPQGAHLPTPPPIPAAIQRSIDYQLARAADLKKKL